MSFIMKPAKVYLLLICLRTTISGLLLGYNTLYKMFYDLFSY